jgi:hypothetical protein
MIRLVALGVLVLSFAAAAWSDLRARRRGARLRRTGELIDESMASRLDIEAVGRGLHPPLKGGQMEWATHRARARGRRNR